MAPEVLMVASAAAIGVFVANELERRHRRRNSGRRDSDYYDYDYNDNDNDDDDSEEETFDRNFRSRSLPPEESVGRFSTNRPSAVNRTMYENFDTSEPKPLPPPHRPMTTSSRLTTRPIATHPSTRPVLGRHCQTCHTNHIGMRSNCPRQASATRRNPQLSMLDRYRRPNTQICGQCGGLFSPLRTCLACRRSVPSNDITRYGWCHGCPAVMSRLQESNQSGNSHGGRRRLNTRNLTAAGPWCLH